MFRPTKRQRLECPPSWMDVGSLEKVIAAPCGAVPKQENKNACTYLETNPIDGTVADIILDRFQKELVDAFHINFSNPLQEKIKKDGVGNASTTEDDTEKYQRLQQAFKQVVSVGINSCTRLLESASIGEGAKPLLVILVSTATPQETLCMAHIPPLCRSCDVPLVLLPDPARAFQFGKILGIRRASILAFMPRSPVLKASKSTDCEFMDSIEKCAASFVEYTKRSILNKQA